MCDSEVIEYAIHIGIQLPEEDYMLELAREGINASLREGWKVFQTPDEEFIYLDVATGEFSEEHPVDILLREKVEQFREKLEEELRN